MDGHHRVTLRGEARTAINLVAPWDYAQLSEAVEAWGFRLMQDEHTFLDRSTIAARWHAEEFVPVVALLERYRLIRTHRWDDEVIMALRDRR